MNLEQMKERKRELGYTYEQIAELSGVPLGTVQRNLQVVQQHPQDTRRRVHWNRFFRKKTLFVKEVAAVYGSKKAGRIYGRGLPCFAGGSGRN